MFKKKYNIETQTRFLTQFVWVKKVIDSCKTMDQLDVGGQLMSVFMNKYKTCIHPHLFKNICNKLFQYWYQKAIDL